MNQMHREKMENLEQQRRDDNKRMHRSTERAARAARPSREDRGE